MAFDPIFTSFRWLRDLFLRSAFKVIHWKSSSQALKVLFILCLGLKTRLNGPCSRLGLKLAQHSMEKYSVLDCAMQARWVMNCSFFTMNCWFFVMNCWFFVEMRWYRLFNRPLQCPSNMQVKKEDWTGSRRWAMANIQFPNIKDQFADIALTQCSLISVFRPNFILQNLRWPQTSVHSIWRLCHRGRWTCRSLSPMAAERRCWRKRGAFVSWRTNIVCSLTKLATSMRR